MKAQIPTLTTKGKKLKTQTFSSPEVIKQIKQAIFIKKKEVCTSRITPSTLNWQHNTAVSLEARTKLHFLMAISDSKAVIRSRSQV